MYAVDFFNFDYSFIPLQVKIVGALFNSHRLPLFHVNLSRFYLSRTIILFVAANNNNY